MNRKKVLLLSILVLTVVGVLVSINFKKEESSLNISPIKEEDTLSMMLETAYESGEYKQVTQSSWPTKGYTFNPTLSKCENGSELSWDDEQKLVYFAGNNVDKCYVYFDKLPVYAIIYQTFNVPTVTGVTEAGAGEIVNIIIDFGGKDCRYGQIIGFPTSITDMTCGTDKYNISPSIESSTIKANFYGAVICQFTMPSENIEFTNIEAARICID